MESYEILLKFYLWHMNFVSSEVPLSANLEGSDSDKTST